MKPLKKTVLYRWYNGLWNEGKTELIDELIHTDAVAHGITPSHLPPGSEGIKIFYADIIEQFDKIHLTIERVVCEDDMEVARLNVEARHKHSRKMVSFPGLSMCRIKDGKIAEAWNNFDFLNMYQQIGMKLK